ncbi:hypothetical protein OZH56_25490, partial [Escherichia coli]|nr:hypothetical protein [Escherichia coli]MCZ0372733.1 hypothetical protein [Escherichia coli]
MWKQNYILVDEYFFFCCTWIVNSASKKAESLSSSHEKVKVLNELRQFYPLDELLRAAEIPRSTFYY